MLAITDLNQIMEVRHELQDACRPLKIHHLNYLSERIRQKKYYIHEALQTNPTQAVALSYELEDLMLERENLKIILLRSAVKLSCERKLEGVQGSKAALQALELQRVAS